MIRSVLAVLTGLMAQTTALFAIDAVAEPWMLQTFPDALPSRAAISHNIWATIFMFVYSSKCIAGGGYVAAWLARRLEIRHAVIMGAIQAALVIPAMIAYPDESPLWHWILGIVLIVPAAGGGGFIRARQTKGRVS